MSANLTSDKIMKELAAGEYDLEWLDANLTFVREMAREILDRRSDSRTRIHVFGDDVPKAVRPWRAAWLAYVEQAGRCWCGVGKEGTASWACEHVKCASDVGALVEARTTSKIASPPSPEPVPIRLHCPACGELHVDEGEFAHKPHHTHACQNDECGMVWRPAIVPTVGVRFLPGFKNEGRRT